MIILIIWVDIFFCSGYAYNNNNRKVTTTVAVSKDSITSYIHDVGFVEWKITKKLTERRGKYGLLEQAHFLIKNDIGEGYYFIQGNKIFLYAYFNIDGNEFRYNITYTIRKRTKEGIDFGLYSRTNTSD